ncbi:MAG: cobalt-precorrin 5A hydrolase [Desulfovibrionaceae bacterium]
MERVAIYAVTADGAELGRGLSAALGADLYVSARLARPGERGFDGLGALVARTFREYGGHVFVAAAGVAVRVVAPLLGGKAADPAVVAVDQSGRWAVSLVSGHVGGANELARRVAAACGAEAVVTTATDRAGLPAVDELAARRGLRFDDLGGAKAVAAALLEGRAVQLHDPGDWLGLAGREGFDICGPEAWDAARPGVWTDWRSGPEASGPGPGTFRVYPPCLFAGVGFRRGVSAGEIEEFVRSAFDRAGLALASLAGLGTAWVKRGDAALEAAGARLGAPVTYFEAEELNAVSLPPEAAGAGREGSAAQRHLGVKSVCEAAAIRLAGGGPLVLAKVKNPRTTLAVACSRR